MNKVEYQETWPSSWKKSYSYDLLEIYNKKSKNLAYVYAYANRRKHTLELVRKVAKPGATILDVAAAQGNFSLLLAELGYEVTWNDLREELIDYVKLKWESGTLNYAPGNVFDLGFERDFDIVLIAEIIEHVAHPDEFLRKIARMVKPGGYIVMSTPNGEYFRNRLPKFSDCQDPSQFEATQFRPDADGHIFLLHSNEVEEIARQAGLTVVENRLVTNPLTSGYLKLAKILNILPQSWVYAFERFTQSLPGDLKNKLSTCLISLLRVDN